MTIRMELCDQIEPEIRGDAMINITVNQETTTIEMDGQRIKLTNSQFNLMSMMHATFWRAHTKAMEET